MAEIPCSPQPYIPPQLRGCLDRLKCVLPKGFFEGCDDACAADQKLLLLMDQALQDYNHSSPCENYSLENMPSDLCSLVIMGASYYAAIFKQMDYALVDISYSDGGLSVSLDRVSKIGTVITTFATMWERLILNRKKCVIFAVGGSGLGTPRFQGALTRMTSMMGSGATGWGMP